MNYQLWAERCQTASIFAGIENYPDIQGVGDTLNGALDSQFAAQPTTADDAGLGTGGVRDQVTTVGSHVRSLLPSSGGCTPLSFNLGSLGTFSAANTCSVVSTIRDVLSWIFAISAGLYIWHRLSNTASGA